MLLTIWGMCFLKQLFLIESQKSMEKINKPSLKSKLDSEEDLLSFIEKGE